MSYKIEDTTVHGPCFPTDLLFNADAVERYCTTGLQSIKALVKMLQGRVALETSYAIELKQLAQFPQIDKLEEGTVKDAMQQLRAQYLNESVQHRLLSTSLQEDVCAPLQDLYHEAVQKQQTLVKVMATIKRESKEMEEGYRKEVEAFIKCFHQACSSFTSAVDAGIPATLIDEQYQQLLSCKQAFNTVVSNRASRRKIGPKPMALRKTLSSTSKVSRHSFKKDLNHMNSMFVGWLLPNQKQKQETCGAQSIQAIACAEDRRIKCHQRWQIFENARLQQYRTLQYVLTEYQSLEEKRVKCLKSNLRKLIVFESSSIANVQYDWQMMSKRLEEISPRDDLRVFIKKEGRVLTRDTTIRAFSAPESLPELTPPDLPLSIQDITLRKIPNPSQPSRSVFGLLVTREPTDSMVVEPAEVVNHAVDVTFTTDSDEVREGMLKLRHGTFSSSEEAADLDIDDRERQTSDETLNQLT